MYACSDVYSSVHMDTAKCNPLVVLATGTDMCDNCLYILPGRESQRHCCLGALRGSSASSRPAVLLFLELN